MDMDTLREMETTLAGYKADEKRRDEIPGYRCCELALEALRDGCYGVGAVLVDEGGHIIAEARNEVFRNGFHSDRHAEMVAVDDFEKQFPFYGDRGGLTMVVSLEPCPMCFTRLLLAGIGRLIYLAEDRQGGMAHRLKKMPEVWRNLAGLQNSEKADASQTLVALAARLARFELDEKRRKLLKVIRT